MDRTDQVVEAFPSIKSIADESLSEGVMAAWTTAMADNEVDDLEAIHWYPPMQAELGIPDETLVPHVREVVEAATGLADVFEGRRGLDLDRDVVLAGALVHDVSKLYEYDGDEPTEIDELLGHPHFGIHVAAAAGLPVDVQHVLAAHSRNTAIEPATIEAEIVCRADEVAASAIKLRGVDDLREA
jgi:HD superfamily phosphodiesterase